MCEICAFLKLFEDPADLSGPARGVQACLRVSHSKSVSCDGFVRTVCDGAFWRCSDSAEHEAQMSCNEVLQRGRSCHNYDPPHDNHRTGPQAAQIRADPESHLNVPRGIEIIQKDCSDESD
jgi:hypothetical protein